MWQSHTARPASFAGIHHPHLSVRPYSRERPLAMATRIYIASDLHAAEKAWRKFINAISLNVYKADVALLAGDLTGKAIVPILERDGGYEADGLGAHRHARAA